ncbi:MAG TPA: hypothetical protein VMA75_00645 [Candidatus Paceibacterota bacterium]|nr:hypothetical protein [Candidatus Paceibacterota bacterium]
MATSLKGSRGMQLLAKASQFQGTLKKCPAPKLLHDSKNRNAVLEFRLARPAPLSPKGKSAKFKGRVCVIAPTRSNRILVVGAVENGPDHTFLFSAECDPETMEGDIVFHNASDPELNRDADISKAA